MIRTLLWSMLIWFVLLGLAATAIIGWIGAQAISGFRQWRLRRREAIALDVDPVRALRKGGRS